MIDGYLVNLGVLQGYSPPNGRFMAHTLFVAATVNYLMQAFLRVENDQDTYLERVDAAQASWLRLCSRINSGNERLRKHLRA